MRALLSVKDLSVSFGSHQVLQNITFDVFSQDFICIVGANGSGKSTLVKAILGLTPPSSGKISFGKAPSQKAPNDKLTRHSIGYLPQETKIDQNFPATVAEIVLSGNLGKMKFQPFYRAAAKSAATHSLQLLGISHLSTSPFAELSGGQKQKVLLARALTATTKLLILDEPSNSLDHDSRRDFYATLLQLNREQGLTILMITHDLDASDLIGSKVLALSNKTATLSTTKDYLARFR